jgi:uncharacterized protein YgbK (DUF1537 family)
MKRRKIVVIDDDPTGSQTVHSCLLLTRWDVDTLRIALLDPSPIFFVLSNTRSLPQQEAAEITREIAKNLNKALLEIGKDAEWAILFVSRSDSTLRGHFPVETNILQEELGPFDAMFVVPSFIEGGRITVDGHHYLLDKSNKRIPVEETEFAKDSVFGFSSSYLPLYIEEKTKRRISENEVQKITLELIRSSQLDPVINSLENNQCCCVDAENLGDLDKFAHSIWSAAENGSRFLFRSGAGILSALASLPHQPVPGEEMKQLRPNSSPGAIIVGSHVKLTTLQVNNLLEVDSVAPVIIDVNRIGANYEDYLAERITKIETVFEEGFAPVIYTSRQEKSFPTTLERLEFGKIISAFLVEIVQNLPRQISFLISKGGITSNDVLSKGLKLKASRIAGQIITGCSVVQCPDEHRYPGLPVVIFPGNVGDELSLAEAYQRFSKDQS